MLSRISASVFICKLCEGNRHVSRLLFALRLCPPWGPGVVTQVVTWVTPRFSTLSSTSVLCKSQCLLDAYVFKYSRVPGTGLGTLWVVMHFIFSLKSHTLPHGFSVIISWVHRKEATECLAPSPSSGTSSHNQPAWLQIYPSLWQHGALWAATHGRWVGFHHFHQHITAQRSGKLKLFLAQSRPQILTHFPESTAQICLKKSRRSERIYDQSDRGYLGKATVCLSQLWKSLLSERRCEKLKSLTEKQSNTALFLGL